MLIRNEYPSAVYWRMFNPNDTWLWAGVKEGVVQPGNDIGPLDHPARRFKLELRRGNISGPFLSSAGAIYNQGDTYVLGSDGHLQVDVPPVVPVPLPAIRRVVNGFDINVHGLPFTNSFPAVSFPVQELFGFPVAQGYGLCGGMAYATRDHFEAGIPVPASQQTPIGGPLFDYLWQRLIDSFNMPFGRGAPAHYILLQSPALADAGPPTVFGVLSRMGEMIGIEWPRIRATIDSDRVCPIALVYVKTPHPGEIFNNHQVVVFGYEMAGSVVTLLIYDPNCARVEQRLTIDISDVNVHRLSYTARHPIWAFFTTDYVFKQPIGNTPSHGWDTGWRSVGRIIIDSPELVSMRPSNLAIFGRGIENTLWWSESENGGAWRNWESLGGIITSSPGGASWADGRMDIFARGGDGSLVHTWRVGQNWSGSWESLGGQLVGGPDTCSWGPNRLDVFVRGTDNALHHICYENHWSGWESLGGVLTSDPTAVSWGNGRIDVFARGADNALHHICYSGNWSNWESLGGVLTSSPDVASWGPGRLDVFVRGTDNAVWTLCYDGNWRGWVSLGGLISSDPTSVALGPDRLAVVARGLDLGLWIKNYS